MIRSLRVATCLAWLTLAPAAVAQGSPWFGTWKLKLSDPAEKPETLIYSDAGRGAMRMESVEERSILVTRFDGEPATDISKGGDRARTLTIKAMSPTSYAWTFSVNGEPRVRGINTLAADRRSFTEVSWRVKEPARKITLLYERQ